MILPAAKSFLYNIYQIFMRTPVQNVEILSMRRPAASCHKLAAALGGLRNPSRDKTILLSCCFSRT
jgi:hypothetical protein